ncbi:transposase [Pusillimonas sp. ANT_WB101]|uniref:transposase n=1 Tax=Pusillimonas sp. ANT_WB101 TaxID=2597356 RepID=UPI0011EE486F|nr:transposase [Pusillimonas sp. ANT_WB101]KAA0889991.1 transposase [Pusillimonas sp. ANT_WB101]
MQILLFPEAEAVGLQKLACCCKLFARVPWPAWVELVTPYFESAAGQNAVCCSVEVMLRVHVVQQYLGLSDSAMACTLKNQGLVRHLVGLPENEHAVPDESAITALRNVLECHRLTEDDLDCVGMLSRA